MPVSFHRRFAMTHRRMLTRLLLAGGLAACLASAVWTPPLLAQQTGHPPPVTVPIPVSLPVPIPVAVLDFKASPKISGQSEAFSMRIRELLAKDIRFQMMERGPMTLALAANTLWGKPCLETGCAAAAGRALKVEWVIVGELSVFGGKTWRATALMVDVKREQILAAQWIGGEMDFEAFLAEKPGVLALRLIAAASTADSPGRASPLPPSVPRAPPPEPPEKAPGDEPSVPPPGAKKLKRHRPELQRQNPTRLSLTIGEIQIMTIEISDTSGTGEDTFNEVIDAVGVGLGFEWLFPATSPIFSLFTAFHYGRVNEVKLDDDEPGVASGQKVSGVGLPANFGAGGFFSQAEIGAGLNLLLPNWRFQANLTVFSLLVDYDFQDAILSSGQATGWEVRGSGLNATILFEYMTAKRITVGGIFQTGRVYNFGGSRINAYKKEGYGLRGVYTEMVGLRVGYGF